MARKKFKDIAVENFILHYQQKRPIDWAAQFNRQAPLDLEIGFGLGEFLLDQSRDAPERNYVGIELDWQRIKKTLHKIWAIRQPNGQNFFTDNIRILQVEADIALRRLFVPRSLHRVYCLFPCPWPKKGHIRYRLFSRPFCRVVNSRLVDGGFVQIVTDHEPYFEWLQEEVSGSGFRVEGRKISPRFNTKFERKWMGEGQEEFFELILRKSEHMDIPLEEDLPLTVYFVDDFIPDRFCFPGRVGCPSVVQKDFLFDPQRGKAMVHLVAAEEHVTQHVWIVIAKSRRGWYVALAAGQTVLPTPGVALAVRMTAEAVKQTFQENNTTNH
jgi:tRNA (guanine-N7-)-methyltransferase